MNASTMTEYQQRSANTNKRRNATQAHRNAVKLMAQIRAYSKAMAEARRNGTPAPHIDSYVSK